MAKDMKLFKYFMDCKDEQKAKMVKERIETIKQELADQ